jgi:arylsulfatase I/J
MRTGCFLAYSLILVVGALATTSNSKKLPHVLLALIDDWGWADTGYHREAGYTEIKTPVIDKLVASGIELQNHRAFQFCSPSRCALQT